jgi:hypothetical protein
MVAETKKIRRMAVMLGVSLPPASVVDAVFRLSSAVTNTGIAAVVYGVSLATYGKFLIDSEQAAP